MKPSLLSSICRMVTYPDSLQQVGGTFRNPVPQPPMGAVKSLRILWDFLFHKPTGTTPAGQVPVESLTAATLVEAADGTLFRLGHSTLLLKLEGGFWMTDPVFSQRASPVQWAGPKRFHAPPIALRDLPPLKGVILSHDHFDHLDRATILQLADRTEHFLTPLGVGDRLIQWGVSAAKVRQLDWWEETQVGGLRFVATPAQHFSGRSLFDGNRTLWASWVILAEDLRLFFSGDSGYFDGFRAIGERFGPFDLTMMETGAYNVAWPYVHMQPEETLRAHLDLKGRWLLPIHNGTFDLALHRWHEPFDRIAALAEAQGVALTTPRMGEPVNLRRPHEGGSWWLEVDPREAPDPAAAYDGQVPG